MHPYVAVKPTLMLSDKIKTPSGENVGLTMGKNVQPKAQDAGTVINGATGNKHAN